MTVNFSKSAKKTAALLLLFFTALYLFAVITSDSSRSPQTSASQDKNADPNQKPTDPGDQSDREQKAPEQKKPPRPQHTHPAFKERKRDRKKMVDRQIQARDVDDPNVLTAMRTVPRHAFVRQRDERRAYADHPIPIGLGQTISQPYIVGYMTDALKLEPNHKVLEVGTGSGYQAAVCAEIARQVYTIEIIEELADSAKERLKELGYGNVIVKAGDGYFGWPEHGPFDAVIITAAAPLVPAPLIEQLKPGGLMILPLGSPYGSQVLVLITKAQDEKITSKRLLPVGFVPMTGHVTEVK
jgi:protein-L-isoaspartate(D-aspartate) O-methyltransferase